MALKLKKKIRALMKRPVGAQIKVESRAESVRLGHVPE